MSDQLPPAVKYLGASLLIAGLLIVVSFTALMMRTPATTQETTMLGTIPDDAPQPPEGRMAPLDIFEDVVFPDFEGLSQTSAPVDASILDGEVTVVDFIFTHCPLICPEVTSLMMGHTEALKGTGVRFLSISVDPAHDTPEVLAEFASRYDADADRWSFVQAPMEDVNRIADAFGFALLQNEANQIPISADETMANIVHPVQMFLIGPDRKIYGWYYYQMDAEMAQLRLDAKHLATQDK